MMRMLFRHISLNAVRMMDWGGAPVAGREDAKNAVIYVKGDSNLEEHTGGRVDGSENGPYGEFLSDVVSL